MTTQNTNEVVMLNLDAWRSGRMELPAWCCYQSTGPDDYCWTWVSGYETRLEECRECWSCLDENGPDTWRPPTLVE